MKIILFAVTLLMVIPSQAQAQNVSVYSDDFSGSHVDLGPGKYDTQSLARNGITSIVSFKVPTGLKVTLFTKNNFEGNSLVITKDVTPEYLKSKGFGSSDLIMPSMIVERAPVQPTGPYVTIYKDNFSGDLNMLTPGQYEFTELGIGNDQLSSIKIPKGLKVRLYEHGAFQGRSLELTNDASADILIKNKFNDQTSSLIVEVLPVPVKEETRTVVVVPVVVPVVETQKTVVAEPEKVKAANDGEPVVTIYEGDFSGASNNLTSGKYPLDRLGIGNDQLSSIKIPKGFRVTLFDNDAFDGNSLVLTEDTRAGDLLDQQFNNVTSSILVQSIPMVTIYEGDYAGVRRVLDPGKYRGPDMGVTKISSVKVPEGFTLTLFEKDNFLGRSLVLTHDAGTDYLARNNFDNITSSLVVGAKEIGPQITLFKNDFTGTSAQFLPGRYDFRDGGYDDNAVNSIRIPRGLQVTLFENGSFRGRSMVLRADTGSDFFAANQFNGITTSMIVEELPASELYVTVYEQVNTGVSEKLGPGRYKASALRIGNDRISSVKVPKGMRAILHDNENFDGNSMTFESDRDLTVTGVFDNRASSLIIEDIFIPVVTPVVEQTTTIVTPVVVTTTVPVVTKETLPVVTLPPCEMTSQQYDNAVKAVTSKSFRDEKMDMAQLATKGKCMSNVQIRGIAKLFAFEDQSLEFVKYAYDLSNEKSEYYTLADLFNFLSSKSEFTDFLKSK